MRTEPKGKALKCPKCKQQCYFKNDEIYLNKHDQRCIMCECGKEIVLKRI